MYQKYQTDALILRSYERGEADRVYALFTREFGLVWARAVAVRREASRMRFALQSGSYAGLSLVRGKRGWKIAGTQPKALLDPTHAGTRSFARIALLLERLVHGEEINVYVFETLHGAHTALMHDASETHALIELIAVARVLYGLGYLSTEALGDALFIETSYSPEQLAEVNAKRTQLLSMVNKALGETQL